MADRYRTRSLPVLAFQWRINETPSWARLAMQGDNPRIVETNDRMDSSVYIVNPDRGLTRVKEGDWIIQSAGGAISGCDWEIFPLLFVIEEVP